MNHQKVLRLLSLLLVFTMVMAACAGAPAAAPAAEEPAAEAPADEAADEAEAEAPAEEAADEAAAEAPEAEVTAPAEEEAAAEAATSEFETSITIWADDTQTPILLDLAETFQNEYGVGLIVESVADRYDQFPVAAPAGEGPDIIMLAHDRIGGFYESGLLAPIDLGDRTSEFQDAAINAFTYNGELVGLPYAIENLAFFYNTDMVESAPATWDELIEVGSALVDSGDATYALALTGTTYDAYPLQTAFGGYVFGNDGSGYNPEDVGIDGDGMVAAGQFIQRNVEAGLISDSTDWDTAHLQFETGEVPFLMAGPWALDRIRNAGVSYAITQFPAAEQVGQPFLGVQGFSVNALGDNVLLAQTFLTEFIATEAVMAELQAAGNRASAYNAVEVDDSDLVTFGEVGADAQPMPAIPEMGSVWGSWADAFTLIINGEQTPEEALGVAGQQIRDLIAGAQ